MKASKIKENAVTVGGKIPPEVLNGNIDIEVLNRIFSKTVPEITWDFSINAEHIQVSGITVLYQLEFSVIGFFSISNFKQEVKENIAKQLSVELFSMANQYFTREIEKQWAFDTHRSGSLGIGNK